MNQQLYADKWTTIRICFLYDYLSGLTHAESRSRKITFDIRKIKWNIEFEAFVWLLWSTSERSNETLLNLNHLLLIQYLWLILELLVWLRKRWDCSVLKNKSEIAVEKAEHVRQEEVENDVNKSFIGVFHYESAAICR